jgi:hypothetical protein
MLIRLQFTFLTKIYDVIQKVTYEQSSRDGRRESGVLIATNTHDLAFQLGGTFVEDDKKLCSQLLELFQAHSLVHIPKPVLSFV